METILKKQFQISDQLIFSKFSGDYNPMHIDEIKSRRFLYGRPVVHGINLVLSIIESWAIINKKNFIFSSIKASFQSPVFLDQDIFVQYKKDSITRYFELISNNNICVKLFFKLESSNKDNDTNIDLINDFPSEINPKKNDFKSISNMENELNFYLQEICFNKLFPNLKKHSNWFQISTLLTSTRIVGMDCPGLNSIFSGFNFNYNFQNKKTIYKVNRVNRFGMVSININGRLQGTIDAFIRPSHIIQLSYKKIKEYVKIDEFKNQSALIIGGSRGIGEVTAKILAAGGANVLITYNKGKNDAEKVVSDINSHGGVAAMLHYDINVNEEIQFLKLNFEPTDLYYFATPSILPGKVGDFSNELYSTYSLFYLSTFHKLISFWSKKGVFKYFYPSSVYVNEMPDNMLEYSLSKLSSENMCDREMKNNNEIKIYKPRLPRLETDQTVSILPARNNDTANHMLNWLREYECFKKN